MAGNLYSNNGAPVGYGQPRRQVRRQAIVDPATEQMFGQQQDQQDQQGYLRPQVEPRQDYAPEQPQFRDGARTGQYGSGPVNNVGINNFEGMVMDRALSGGDPKSAKDAFARAAAQYNRPLTDVKDDYGSAEEYLNGMMDLMRKEGLNVQGVKGGKILVDSFENPGQYNWVDVIRGAGGDNPAFWWGHDLGANPASKMQAPANGLYNQVQGSILGNQGNPGDALAGMNGQSVTQQLLQYLMQNQNTGSWFTPQAGGMI